MGVEQEHPQEDVQIQFCSKWEAPEGFEPGRDVARLAYLRAPFVPSVENGYEMGTTNCKRVQEMFFICSPQFYYCQRRAQWT